MTIHRTTNRGRIRQAGLGFGGLSTVLLCACGNLTAGGVGGAEVFVSGDAPDAALAAPCAAAAGCHPVAPASRAPALADDDAPEGEIEVELRIYVEADDGAVVELTNGAIDVQVDIGGVEEPRIADSSLPAGRYTTLRIVFSEIEVEVDAGLVIGGVPVVGPIEVERDGVLEVTRAIDLTVESGSSRVVVVDLNAADWLQAVDPTALTVDAAVFAERIAIVVR
jgi:hypothetical protein